MVRFPAIQQLRLRMKLRQINKIDSINSGGCAIVAHSLEAYIRRTSPKLNPIIVYLYYSNEHEKAENIANGNNENCGHAMVQVDDLYYDSKGIHTLQDVLERMDIIQPTIPDLVLRSIRENSWNSYFDRGDAPTICKILNTNFNYQRTN